jgi:hypothetical protein
MSAISLYDKEIANYNFIYGEGTVKKNFFENDLYSYYPCG